MTLRTTSRSVAAPVLARVAPPSGTSMRAWLRSRGVVQSLACVLTLSCVASCSDSRAKLGESGTTLGDPNGNEPGQACVTAGDCKSGSCESGVCVAPQGGPASYTDGIKNGSETDIDCGGDPAHPCAIGQQCKVHADCTTGCGDDGTCATAPSCTRSRGGRTCGPNGAADCCAAAKQGDYSIGKYLVTAGRMRAFVERFQGNIEGFIAALPAGKWDPSWDDAEAIPTDMATANSVLGHTKKKACMQGENTGHTYWTPKTDEDYSDFDQDVLDDKALNCVPWVMLQALCVWDGGHLATVDELRAAFTNGGTTKYPWGDDDLESVSRPDPLARLNIEGGYATTPLPATYRQGTNGQPAETSFLIAPPGRFPKGNNEAGIADAAGNLLEFVGDRPRQFVWKADFEHHAANAASFNNGYFWMHERNNSPPGVGRGPWVWGDGQLYGNAGRAAERNGYYAIGGRCAY